MPVWEIVRLGAKRPKALTSAGTEQELREERREILDRLNRDNDPELARDLARLEAIRDESQEMRRQIQQQKRAAEARRKAAEKRKAEAAKKAAQARRKDEAKPQK